MRPHTGCRRRARPDHLDLDGEQLVVTTHLDERPVIRTTARVGIGTPQRAAGQLRYITRRGERVHQRSLSLRRRLSPSASRCCLARVPRQEHPTYQLRPADPLTMTLGFYSPVDVVLLPRRRGLARYREHGS